MSWQPYMQKSYKSTAKVQQLNRVHVPIKAIRACIMPLQQSWALSSATSTASSSVLLRADTDCQVHMLHVTLSLLQQQVSTSSKLTSNVCGLIARCSTSIHNMPGGLWCQGMSRQAACFALQKHTHSIWTKLVQTEGCSVTPMWSWDCSLIRL